jgi:hypothetical protein
MVEGAVHLQHLLMTTTTTTMATTLWRWHLLLLRDSVGASIAEYGSGSSDFERVLLLLAVVLVLVREILAVTALSFE